MAVTLHCNRIHNATATGHSQLVRSLERILEEANLSGELILTNRKLKDFPKAATKYNLSDTVIADLSRNRFCELPEEVTTFAFLETLLLYHNTIRHIPESVKHLTLLTYLDLRSNQLSSLPREICFLPLQVLLVSNNRLLSLPDELGRMDKLTDLDASYNQLTALPARIGELRSLKSFSLRNNQILYLPRELACLNLISLDVSNNRIASLPLEIRQMTTLVEFNLGNNPLTSPPASLCVRGLVHIFKYLETQATKDEKGCRAGGNYDGYTTLRRAPKQHAGSIFESTRNPRYQVDSGYSTCDGIDKRWSHDLPNRNAKNDLSSPRKALASTTMDNFLLDIRGSDDTIVSKAESAEELPKDSMLTECNVRENNLSKEENVAYNNFGSTSSGSTPEDDMLIENQTFIDRNNKDLGNIQTYKEYKEALKQQRNQEISSVYKIKAMNEMNGSSATEAVESRCKDDNMSYTNENSVCVPKKPVQKVIPSRNTELMTAIFQPKLKDISSLPTNDECLGYIKPSSPMKMLTANDDSSMNNNIVSANGSVRNKLMPTVNGKQQQQQLSSQTNSNRSVTWNHDLPPEKLSFTMRREFDRQREETELLMQLRNIIQVRLKTVLPEDMASALTDGIILCHLANYVRPRSVASIHVPSPGVSKLTMARCRKNVDNFLEACRKIGVDEELICSSEDILPAPDESSLSDDEPKPPVLRNPSAVLKTVSALLLLSSGTMPNTDDLPQFHQDQEQHQQQIKEEHRPPATNMQFTEKWENNMNTMGAVTTTDGENNDEILTTRESQFGKFLRHAKVKTFQKIKSNLNNNINLRFISHSGKDCQLQTIEETEVDSYQIINEKISPVVLKVNDLNSIKSKLLEISSNNNNLNSETSSTDIAVVQCISRNDNDLPEKIVAKRIDYFEDRPIMRVCANDESVNSITTKSIYSIYQTTSNTTNGTIKTNKDKDTIKHEFNILTIVLSCVFIVTFVLLVIFPLPD